MAIATILALAALGSPQPLQGRCVYGDEVVRRAAGTVPVDCNAATIEKRGPVVRLRFDRRDWGPSLRVEGSVDGDKITVSRAAVRTDSAEPATGTCQVFYTDKVISTVSCVVKVGYRTFAANFQASKI